MEWILLGTITSQMKHEWDKWAESHQGQNVLDKPDCLLQLSNLIDDVGWDIVYLNFSKAFDMVSHTLLVQKWMCWGLDKGSVGSCLPGHV